MPWADNAAIMKSIPSLRGLPDAAVSLFRSVANKQVKKGDSDATAVKIAWGVVKQKFKKVDNKWVARSGAFEETNYYVFKTEQAESFVTRTQDGVEVHNYVLTDLWPDSFGTSPTEELMQEWAEWINKNQPEADVDHEIMNKAREVFNDDPLKVEEMVRSKRGIAKAIKASIDRGRLMVSLAFDKRYANHVEKVKGLSIEAAAVKDTLTNKFKKGKLLGFTLAMNSVPSNSRAVKV